MEPFYIILGHRQDMGSYLILSINLIKLDQNCFEALVVSNIGSNDYQRCHSHNQFVYFRWIPLWNESVRDYDYT